MSWNSRVALQLLALACCWTTPAISAEICPSSHHQPLRYVDIFDGSPQELATLVPDGAGEKSGYWELGYIYEAGRFVTVRCKYADGQEVDVKLAKRVTRCAYKIDAKKTLKISCKR